MIDKPPHFGTIYYKIIALKVDGSTITSSIGEYKYYSKQRVQLTLSSSHTSNIFLLESSLPLEWIKICDIHGRTLDFISMNTQNAHVVSINMATYSEGMYIINTKFGAKKLYKTVQ